jgi:alpha-galactosidase
MFPSLRIIGVACGLVLASIPAASAQTNTPAAAEEAVILTPKPPATPRINGAKVFGVRPGHPFLFTIAATGDRPMTFSAEGLPAGLQVDPASGHITGSVAAQGTYTVTLGAKNALGATTRALKVVCGPTIGLTPALGWNSWNIWGSSVTQEKVKAAADAMVSTGLINHGWTYINIDDYWERNDRRATNDPTLGGPGRDADGKIVPNPRFPDMKGLCDYIHNLGLKAGIYSGPGPTTCGGCVASWQHEDQDAASYADWGFDYLKYDWCSYNQVLPAPPAPPPTAATGDTNSAATNGPPRRRGRGAQPTLAQMKLPYQAMRTSLNKVNRDIIFSLCQYGMGNVWEWGAEPGIEGNCWRTTGDIQDNWRSLASIGFSQVGHEKFAGPGHFNDPDMMIVGKVAIGSGKNIKQNLTPNELYTHVSLWSLLTGPLLIGCDLTALDDFTLSLLSNDEVLAVNQDPLGNQATRVAQDGNLEVWAKSMEDGSKAVGLFNRNDADTEATAKWTDIGVTGSQTVRDLWRQQDVGNFTDSFKAMVPHHGAVLVKVSPASAKP